MTDVCLIMEWLIGIDGGGTKTLAVLCDSSGLVHAVSACEATNPTSVPRKTVIKRLTGLLNELLSGIGGRYTAEIKACFGGFGGGGIAGNREFMQEQLQLLLPAAVVKSGSDAVSALTSGIGIDDGIVAIAGTGSSVFARVNGVMNQVGGWGFLLGDEGSGYDLGRRALTAALRAHDGRGKTTVLTALCEKQLGEPIAKAVARIYDLGRTYIASFAPVLLEAQFQGDPVACIQAEEAADGLAEAILAAGRLIIKPVKQVVMSGSVWQPGGFMEKYIKETLGGSFSLICPELPPVYGSASEAALLLGIKINTEFKTRFYKSWMEKKQYV